METEDHHPKLLTPEEARVIASLMGKELTTPNNYPLTLNSLMAACNQKSNREPVMTMNEGQVGNIVNKMADRGLLFVEYGERAIRISHKARSNFKLDRKQQAVLTVLMLRAPQTLNDILTRIGRMVDFSDTEEVLPVVDEMIARQPALVVRFPRGEGRREERYSHLLCGDVEMPKSMESAPGVTGNLTTAEIDRLTILENRVAELEKRVKALADQG